MKETMKKDVNTSPTPSLWISETDVKQYPVLDQDISCQVLVIGGGITGLSCAYELHEAGFDVAVLEKDRLCSKTTGNTTGKMTLQHSDLYSDLLEKRKTKAAKAVLKSQLEALHYFRDITTRLGIDCDQFDAQAVLYGRNEKELKVIAKEKDAYEELGIPYQEVTIPFETGRGLSVDGQIGFNAPKYVFALADHLSQRGVRIFEHSFVKDSLEVAGEGYRVSVNDALTVTAQYVIVASGYPCIDGGAHYSFRLVPSRSMCLAYPTKEFDTHMCITQDDPIHSTRYAKGRQNYLVVAGGSYRVAFENDTVERQQKLDRFARESFHVGPPAYSWFAQDYRAADRLPYIGHLTDKPEHKNIYIATGFRKWGLGFAVWTGRYLAGLIQGTVAEVEEFSPSRDHMTQVVIDQTADKIEMMVKKVTENQPVKELESLGPNQGGIVRISGKKRGVWVDEQGEKVILKTRCTHMGCSLHWNELEKTFDCPCHGSRFTREGYVIEGPAQADLKPVTDDPDE